MKSRGSYLLQWKLIETLKKNGTIVYDLNGINPIANPGTYKFKTDLAGANGKDVYFLGKFDTHNSRVKHFCVRCADRLRTHRRSFRTLLKAAPRPAQQADTIGAEHPSGMSNDGRWSRKEIVQCG
jgi:hypothetical protein